jgi:hypothetical protein
LYDERQDDWCVYWCRTKVTVFFTNCFDHVLVSTPIPIDDMALDDNECQILASSCISSIVNVILRLKHEILLFVTNEEHFSFLSSCDIQPVYP